MKKLILIILSVFLFQKSHAQQVVVALPAMNVIYIGLENPVAIAVEGIKYSELSISTDGCILYGTHPNTYITALVGSPNGCSIFISYKKENKAQTDTFHFRIKSIPKPEAMFGTLESGSYPAAAMLGQNTIRAVLPNFVFEGIYYSVTSYHWKYVSHSNLTVCLDTVNGALIPSKLKDLIKQGGKGDLIRIDSIICVSPMGNKKLLSAFELYIDGKKTKDNNPNLLSYQIDGKEKATYFPFQPIYGCNQEPLFAPGILKLYCTNLTDTVVVSEIHIASKYLLQIKANRTVYLKDYYSSGKIKSIYNFEVSDTIGLAIKYYENGQKMSEGKVIFRAPNISATPQKSFYFGNITIEEAALSIEKFIDKDYAPIGNWNVYHENGKIGLECNFKLERYDNLEYEIDTAVLTRCGNHSVKFYSIIDALKHPQNHYYPELSSYCKAYDKSGKLISERNFKE